MTELAFDSPVLPHVDQAISARTCYHCGEPVPRDAPWRVVIEGAPRALCCAGCQAVAETILAHGLDAFYRERSAPAPGPAALTPEVRQMLAALDDPAIAPRYASTTSADARTATLTLGGLSCAACAWLLERRLGRLPGVLDCAVNYATRHARVTWRPGEATFSAIVTAARELGFDAAPLATGTRHAELTQEYRRELRRFGVAMLCAMQVMMIAAGLYFDAVDDGTGLVRALNVVCAAFSVPVITYCAMPFYRGAWRALRTRSVSMDVPVTLGIALGFGGSLLALAHGSDVVYFDSVTMFVSLLLLSRLVELGAWRRSSSYLDDLTRVEPMLVDRVIATPDGETVQRVQSNALALGDRIRVAAGATVPCDGTVAAGTSALDERLLTGEATPRRRGPGDRVVGGSTNVDSPLDVVVTALGHDTVLARIGALAREALAKKPALLSRAQSAASLFIWIVLALAGITAAWHGLWRGDPWLAPTLVVLVISCPCALALAVPTAVSMAMANLLRHGVLVLQPDALARFARVRRIVFDKTGTLTTGDVRLAALTPVDGVGDLDGAQWLAIACALEHGSAHPLARALAAAAPSGLPEITGRAQHVGSGVEGVCDGRHYRLGSAAWLQRAGITVPADLPEAPAALKVAWLARDDRAVARLTFVDDARAEARAVVDHFVRHGVAPTILSGDQRRPVAALAQALGIADAHAECDPAAKLARLESLMADGHGVAAVGDGINDSPILARADVGITLGAASAYAKLNADMVLLDAGLTGLVTAHDTAHRLDRIARQNLNWALAYNGIALPLALAGVVAPWVAAFLMAASSLLVVGNASRLYRRTV